MNPNTLFILHLQAAMEMMTKRSMRKSSTMAQKSPLLLTGTGANEWQSENISQGTGRLQQHVTYSYIMHINVLILPVVLISSPHGDVKYVAAYRAGHRHVSQAFPSDDHAGY